ncbi:MAG: Rrf2 family transcriptional regulator [Desulfobacteraceae bacterium]|nr:MAG: Rrf2 family transcriptional regulator [Desulfobacteraceae bacterium]
MQITRQTEYAIRTLLELSRVPFGKLLQTRVISERQGIPEVFLTKTVQVLALAGLVQTQRGTQGGVKLAVPGDQITLADIITAIEGTLAINICLAENYSCPNMATCKVHQVFRRAQEAMLSELNSVTLSDLVETEKMQVSLENE